MATKDEIGLIKKQYFCCIPIPKFDFTTLDEKFDHDTQIKIFQNTIGESYSEKYPSRLSYRTAFLRKLIEKAEKSGDEVYDKFYQVLTNYMMLNDDSISVHYRQFLITQENNENRIIVEESKSLISEGTTGLRTWQAAFSLAEWCYLNKPEIRDKSILELGSGVGLSGLSVIKISSPKSYIFSDCHSRVLDILVKNVRLNLEVNDKDSELSNISRFVEWNEESYKTKYQSTNVRITRLDWSSIEDSNANDSWTNPEVVLAADVIYDESLFQQLIQALRFFITRTNALVIVAATVRNNETLEKFFQVLANYGLSFEDEEVPKPFLFLQCDDTPVRILKIFNKN